MSNLNIFALDFSFFSLDRAGTFMSKAVTLQGRMRSHSDWLQS